VLDIQLLEESDTIRATDWIRQLSLIYTGQSDYLATSNTYGGSPMNRLGWIRVDHYCPFWVGKTVGEYNHAMEGKDRHAVEKCQFEFIRGMIPKSHMESLK